MKRVYLSVRSLLSAGASLLLGWLGFASCTESLGGGMAEYGTPTVDYEFKVRVTDQDAKPVEGLQVDLLNGRGDKKELTDAQGKAELEGSYTGFRRDHQIVLEVKDIDGDTNGIIADQRDTIDIKESDFVSKGSGNWNNGKVKKEIEIQVERK
ncbi:radical SAM-associated putative lipoprotein [uncultured Porphyromonas sp.]|uniref:radical SAM-associated putative lipoprotein n=1 Tax=uncultured Porphyromonas sp. TaxID=159274 RepID=UPI00262AE26F|nr:radical SAM-associated putative lipoprotein [uncultured Porphyromonas sp.]